MQQCVHWQRVDWHKFKQIHKYKQYVWCGFRTQTIQMSFCTQKEVNSDWVRTKKKLCDGFTGND